MVSLSQILSIPRPLVLMSVIVEGLFCLSAQQFLLGLQLLLIKEIAFPKPSAMGTSSAD